MALLGSFTKQPREVLDCDFTYSTVLAGRTETISGQTAQITPSGALSISSSNIFDGNKIKYILSGGLTGTTYKLTVLATSTAGLIYEDEINIVVEEV